RLVRGKLPAVRALVTGATGFLGSAVARELLRDGHRVRVLARRTSNRANVAGLEGVEVVEGDLRDRASLGRALSGCEALFHVAASYSLWTRDPRELYASNVDGTAAILEEALARRIERVVYTSSVAVLRPPLPGEPPADETCEYARFEDIVGHYKRSKYLAEQAAQAVRAKGLPVVIVLPSTPIGPRDVKPTPTGKIVLDFLLGKMPGYVQTGLNVVDVDDCARGHLLALERGRPGERYILGNENLTLKEILDALAELTGLPGPRFRVPYALAYTVGAFSTGLAALTGREPGVPLDGVRMSRKMMFFDPSKARRELGFPATPAREALRKAALWFCENGHVPEALASRARLHLARGGAIVATCRS
ncbi:MAG TPA: hopanoid-associated sugar epimerase, partial [Planctomycetota bacterium]|nr:hopanoid-associated sugar epimerase [Planctomycetota bacterium]